LTASMSDLAAKGARPILAHSGNWASGRFWIT
jgi:thiamine monophosphate kinase